jgi:transketolase C-terminal domain/subunit
MANVTDPNPWGAIPLSDSQRHVQASQQHVVPQQSNHDAWLLKESYRAEQEFKTVELSTALHNLFDIAHDQVVWNLSSSRSTGPPGDEQYIRVDPRHGYGPAIARSVSAAKIETSEHAGSNSWLIIVDEARDLLVGDRIDQLETALEQVPRILLVACEDEEAPGSAASDVEEASARRAVEISARLRFEYVGPIAEGDSRCLLETLAQIKQLGRPTLLHLKTNPRSGTRLEPHPTDDSPALDAVQQTEPAVGLPRHVASEQLAQLARDDGRVVAVSTDLDISLLGPWTTIPNRMFPVASGVPHALEWCASLAAGGSRPFAFLSWEELQNCFGDVRQSICLKRAAVTLIVEPRRQTTGAERVSSAGLAGIRQLPHTSLLSPKDANELRQMLAWCASQHDPVVIWLPQGVEPQVALTHSSPVVLGQAEQLTEGFDVAIVAWGPQVAAAHAAAAKLAQQGIGATIVNARFAQPLDLDTIARAVRGAQCAVLVDDADARGGFSSWVLEHLLRLGVTQPVSILGPQERSLDQVDVQNQLAVAIFEHCRWLSAPILPGLTVEAPLPVVTPVECKAVGTNWATYLGGQAERMARERAQIQARQLSSDVRRWVVAYEEIGSRDLYLWKWCMHGVELTTLPCVLPEFRAHVCDTKVLSIVLCVLLDDVADQHGDSHLLDALLEMTCWGVSRSLRGLSAVERRHAELTRRLWAEYQARIAGYPCYHTFEPVLRYDLLQFFNTMRYSYLVNGRPYLLNMVEHDLYTSHNMMMISFAMLDLMCSPGFPQAEVGTLREAMWHAQCMGRIGNLLSTWRRELVDRDFTSGVFARAMMEGDLTLDELEHGDSTRLETTIRARGHESYFFRKWLEHRERCHASAQRIHSLDLKSVLDGHDRFFAMHLGSQGLI